MQYQADFKSIPARLIETSETFKVICAWCKKVIREGKSANVSHGICNLCFGIALNDNGIKFKSCGEPALNLAEITKRISERFKTKIKYGGL